MEQDKFEEIWQTQLAFNQKFFKQKLNKEMEDLTMEERITWTKNHLLSIVKEAMEVLDEIPNWKEHRNEKGNRMITSNLLEEIIDVNKFSLGLAQLWDMSGEDFYSEFKRKSIVVEQRWAQEYELQSIGKEDKVVGIDIDGVLGMYHHWFTEYCKTVHGIPVDTFSDIKKVLKPEVYADIKRQYRESGWKATMPAFPGSSEVTHKLKKLGYTIIILTARPYKEFSRIYPDTLEFLRKNDIQFDAVIWDKKKHIKIINEFPNLEFMIEDTPSVAVEVADAGYPVYMPMNEMNKDFTKHDRIYSIDSIKSLLNYL